LPSPLYIAGTGSFAAEVAEWALESGDEPAGLIELIDPQRVGSRIHGLEVISIENPPPAARAMIGTGGDRAATWEPLRRAGWAAGGLRHPRAHVAGSARLSPSATIGPLAVIGAATTVGDGVIVSRGSLIGHHAEIADFATLNPGVNLGGNSRIGDGAFVGMGAVVLNGVSVGARAVVAAGAVAISDVPDDGRVQGVPARPHTR